MTRLSLNPSRLALLAALPLFAGAMTLPAEAKAPCRPHVVKVVVRKVVCDCASSAKAKPRVSPHAARVKTSHRLANRTVYDDPIRETPYVADGPTVLLTDGYASSTTSYSKRVVITRSVGSHACDEACDYPSAGADCDTLCTTMPPQMQGQPCDDETCGDPDDRVYYDDQSYSDEDPYGDATSYGGQSPYIDNRTYISGGGGYASDAAYAGLAASAIYLRWGNRYRDHDHNDHTGNGGHDGHGQGHGQDHGGWQGGHDHWGHQGGDQGAHQGHDGGATHQGRTYQGGYTHSGGQAGGWQGNGGHMNGQWHAGHSGGGMSGHMPSMSGHPAYHPQPVSVPHAPMAHPGHAGGWRK